MQNHRTWTFHSPSLKSVCRSICLALALAFPGLATTQITDYNYYGIVSVQTWGSSVSGQQNGNFLETSSYYSEGNLTAYAQANGIAEFRQDGFFSSTVADIVNFAQWQGAQADMAGMQANLQFYVEPGWYSLSYHGVAGTSGTSLAEGWFRFGTSSTGWIKDETYFAGAGFSDALEWSGYLPGGSIYLSWAHSVVNGFSFPTTPVHATAFQTVEFQAVPEPGTLAIVGLGVAGWWRKRRKPTSLPLNF